jgi:hypothetical protein
VTVHWKGAPAYVIKRAELRLDGLGLGFGGQAGQRRAHQGRRAAGQAGPARADRAPRDQARHRGQGAEGGRQGRRPDRLHLEHTFAIIVPDGKRTTVVITGDEDGDLPEYEPEIEVELETEK